MTKYGKNKKDGQVDNKKVMKMKKKQIQTKKRNKRMAKYEKR